MYFGDAKFTFAWLGYLGQMLKHKPYLIVRLKYRIYKWDGDQKKSGDSIVR